MQPDEKTTILRRIHSAEGNIRAIINMMETENNCEKVLLQLQSTQVHLHATGHLLLLYQLQQNIENICHNNCPEKRIAEVERLIDIYRFILIYS